jgi:HEAT repeat protein
MMKTMKIPMRFALALMAPFVLTILLSGCGTEPEYEGISLKNWVKQLESSEQTLRIEAAEAIGHIGLKAKDAVPELRDIAERDPMPKVRVAAILALKELGVKKSEYDAYLEEVTTPLIEPMSEMDSLEFSDEEGQFSEDYMFNALSEDDIEYLQQLEAPSDSDSVAYEDDMPQDPDEQKDWLETRRKEQVTALLQQFRNPEVLSELLRAGDITEKRFAARMLAGQTGGMNQRVYEALQSAITDPDTLLKKLSAEALKKWEKE